MRNSVVHIDGEIIQTVDDFHKQIATLLDFGPYYGGNLSALWDRLSKDVERPVTVVWHNSKISRKHMGRSSYNSIVRILKDVRQQDKNFGLMERFDFELK